MKNEEGMGTEFVYCRSGKIQAPFKDIFLKIQGPVKSTEQHKYFSSTSLHTEFQLYFWKRKSACKLTMFTKF